MLEFIIQHEGEISHAHVTRFFFQLLFLENDIELYILRRALSISERRVSNLETLQFFLMI
jgi:hypothetical protein